uniref:Uncharacterized protein n=1 Tax=Sphaerodactylus townsendi TaxID=933632 RepID=A0ACB8FVH2_9SAUR
MGSTAMDAKKKDAAAGGKKNSGQKKRMLHVHIPKILPLLGALKPTSAKMAYQRLQSQQERILGLKREISVGKAAVKIWYPFSSEHG